MTAIRIITSLIFILSLPSMSLAESQPLKLWNLSEEEVYDLPTEQEVQEAQKRIQEKFFQPVLLFSLETRGNILKKYEHLDPNHLVPDNLLEEALLYFDVNKKNFENQKYITVVDFNMRSNKARMFVINMEDGSVVAVRTAHGRGGDKDHDGYVESLGNVPNSKKSSRGYYQVSEIYYGKYGRSIRLDGLSSTNSNVRRRAIVVHGSDYVWEDDVIQGRSWGCFALAWSVKDDIVDLIHGGSLLYAERS